MGQLVIIAERVFGGSKGKTEGDTNKGVSFDTPTPLLRLPLHILLLLLLSPSFPPSIQNIFCASAKCLFLFPCYIGGGDGTTDGRTDSQPMDRRRRRRRKTGTLKEKKTGRRGKQAIVVENETHTCRGVCVCVYVYGGSREACESHRPETSRFYFFLVLVVVAVLSASFSSFLYLEWITNKDTSLLLF
uniref:Transmembrane protein n=1 Tax=Caenorhabditis tropicalis TaxID=1561998 RepID=A0A1I7TWX8_9PELO